MFFRIMIRNRQMFFICYSFLLICVPLLTRGSVNHTHPHPEAVVQHLQRRLNVSVSRKLSSSSSKCLTGNPIDDCWRCSGDWRSNRQSLADCAIGFGSSAYGGKGGLIYTVTDSSDDDVITPRKGTLRYGVIQSEPLWIIFSTSMGIRLKHELILNSYKTIDGRGVNVEIFGGGCLTVQDISHIIIHGIHIHDCISTGNVDIRSSPTHMGYRTKSDGDGISLFHAHDIWIDHCSLSHCTDGLIDAIMGSTAISITNNYFTHHDEVMLLGHSDDYSADAGMQVTIAFNHFGEGLVQRMPRCRLGYIHVVNNDFTEWEMYAIGGSANPTILSQGNRYTAPENFNAKEVTKRVETDEKEWTRWIWRSDGDTLANGAFFVSSGEGVSTLYAKADSVEPKSAVFIDHITMDAGVIGNPRGNYGSNSPTSSGDRGDDDDGSSSSSTNSNGSGDFFGMIFGNGVECRPAPSLHCVLFVFIFLILIRCNVTAGGFLPFVIFL